MSQQNPGCATIAAFVAITAYSAGLWAAVGACLVGLWMFSQLSKLGRALGGGD